MKVSRIGNDKIITFGPYVNGPYKYETTVYEHGQGARRLIVDSVYKNGELARQNKTYTVNGQRIKEIVIEFANGVRTNLLEVFKAR